MTAVVAVGSRVRIERDETRHPSKGTWPRFRGKTGTVVEVSEDRKRPHLTEYAVIFGRVKPRADGRGAFAWSGNESVTWFKAHELFSMSGGAAVRPAGARCTNTKTNHLQETAA